VIRVVIDFDPRNGNMRVTGPLHDKLLMLGLLEAAKMQLAPPRPAAEAPSPILLAETTGG
jgi:hypothetical protein